MDAFVDCWSTYNQIYNFNIFVETEIRLEDRNIISLDGLHLFQHINRNNGIYSLTYSYRKYRFGRDRGYNDYFRTEGRLIPTEIPDVNNPIVKIFRSYDEACQFVLNALKERPDIYEIYLPPFKSIDDIYEEFRYQYIDYDL